MKSIKDWLSQNKKQIESLSGLDWNDICCQCKLTEDFIRENADKVNWIWISRNQKLSEYFILEFKDKLHFEYMVSCFYSEKLQKQIESFWIYKKL